MKTGQIIALCAAVLVSGLVTGFGPKHYEKAYPSGPDAALWEYCAEFTLRFSYDKMDRCVAMTNIGRRSDPSYKHWRDPN